ncbi:MAG: flagellar biosynthetic protein FliO [Puniceicoccales bacterium]|nr:flagellar biosynthetic protein FliO [Puniceicoccales bacterium]
MTCPNIFSFFAEARANDISFVNSLFMVVVFLSILGFCGYMIVRFCKRGSFVGNHTTGDGTKKIKILDNKFLYGRKYITLVECCGKRLLILVNRDDAVKLSEWEVGKNEADR